MNIKEAELATGFVKCTFEDDGDPCENCNQIPNQLYFRSTDYFSNDGEYFCKKCVVKEAKENSRYTISEKKRQKLITESFCDS